MVWRRSRRRRVSVPMLLGFGLLALLAVAAGAHATHFWAGTLGWEKDALSVQTEKERAPVANVTGYLSFDTTAVAPTCDGLAMNQVLQADPSLGTLTANGVPRAYALQVEYLDPYTHCRFVGAIVAPDGGTLRVPVAAPVQLAWGVTPQFCCRESVDHVNNPGGTAQLLSTIGTDANNAPVVKFDRLSTTTDHGTSGYGNHHCFANTYCMWYIPAMDHDGDALEFDLATSVEASGGPGFQQPGPAVGTGPLTVDDEGLVVWDTRGAQEDKIYSTQIIVSDGKASVAVDFMIEVSEGCPDGQVGYVEDGILQCGCEVRIMDPHHAEEDARANGGPGTPPDGGPPPVDCAPPPCAGSDPRSCGPLQPPPPGKPYTHRFWPVGRTLPATEPSVSDVEERTQAVHDTLDAASADADSDGDGIRDADDLCPDGPGDTADLDGDGRGDACDPDDDGDGYLDGADACPRDSDAYCGLARPPTEAAGSDGHAARGFFDPTTHLQDGRKSAAVHDVPSPVQHGLPLLGIVLAAIAIVILLARRSP